MLMLSLREIGAYCRRHPATVKRWIETRGFPAARLPDGRWTTSEALIDGWLLARARIQRSDEWLRDRKRRYENRMLARMREQERRNTLKAQSSQQAPTKRT